MEFVSTQDVRSFLFGVFCPQATQYEVHKVHGLWSPLQLVFDNRSESGVFQIPVTCCKHISPMYKH